MNIVFLNYYAIKYATLINCIGLVLGLLGIPLAIVLYFKGRKLKMPLFTVNRNKPTSSMDREGTCFTEIALWNGGKDYIDNSDILSNITINADEAKILSASIDKKSREDLPLVLTVNDDGIELSIKGDDVIENKDGVLIHILYEGSEKCKWTVHSRIKGVPSGFQEISWNIMKCQNHGLILFLDIIFVACFILMGGLCVYSLYYNEVKIKLYAYAWIAAAIWYFIYAGIVFYYRIYWPRWLKLGGSLIG